MRYLPRETPYFIIVGLLAAAPAAFAQVPVGEELQVNSYTTSNQREPAVAVSAGGDFVVVWQSDGSGGDDDDAFSIQGQRYSSSGATLGAELQINSFTTNNQVNSGVAVGGNGDVFVVWQSDGSSGTDSSSHSIQGRRYSSSGMALGGQFQVNTYTTSFQFAPAIAVAGNGNFVVVWESEGSDGDDDDAFSIQGQRYDSSGTKIGDQFQANTYTANNQLQAQVAAGSNGDFVVVWGSEDGDGSSYSVQGQLFSSMGTKVGDEFQANTYTTGAQDDASVAFTANGELIVVWESPGSNGDDMSGSSILGQRFDNMGSKEGGELVLNSYTTSSQGTPSVASDADGDFVVVWRSFGSVGNDAGSNSVQGQRFSSTGTKLGDQFQVNTYTTGHQDTPAVAAAPKGDFVVVWDTDPTTTDPAANSVRAQRFRVTGDVGDRVWLDADFDGLQDPGEPGIAGVDVHLFDDMSTLLDSTTTDGTGLFAFQAKPGQYYLQFDLPPEYSFTASNQGADDAIDSDADPATGETDTFVVTTLGIDTTWDAGMANGIGDFVWFDTNGDGLQNNGEEGIGSIVVRLLTSPAGTLVGSRVTGRDGRFAFASLTPGDYYLEFLTPPGSVFTTQNAGDDTLDSDVDPGTGATPPFAFVGGSLDLKWDAGLSVYTAGIFDDGFESGDTSAWSSAVP
jgi:hypothetical protein